MRKVFQAAADRYRGNPSLYYYAKGKTALDPVYPLAVETFRNSARPLLDLGCGMGLLAGCLRAAGHDAPIRGCDIDVQKIGEAQRVLGDEKTQFTVASALDMPEHSGDVIMLDVIQYFTDEEQQVLLRRVADRIAGGGQAFIRLTLNEPTWRYQMTRLEERFIQLCRWIPVAGWNFPTREEMLRPFSTEEFEIGVRPMWGLTPFNSYLFTFRRRDIPSPVR